MEKRPLTWLTEGSSAVRDEAGLRRVRSAEVERKGELSRALDDRECRIVEAGAAEEHGDDH